MPDDLRNGIVRVHKAKEPTKVVGTGFVVSDAGLIVTCAHVVQAAADIKAPSKETTIEIPISFLISDKPFRTVVKHEYWSPPVDGDDIAILQLDGSLPERVIPLKLGPSVRSADQKYEAYGFPPTATNTDGEWAKGSIANPIDRSPQASSDEKDSRLQLEVDYSAEIEGGYSGSPVWLPERQRVVGMLFSIRQGKTALAIASKVLLKVCPIIPQPSSLCPYKGLEPFGEKDSDLFYGRQRVIDEDIIPILERSKQFLAILGPSGSGKSSLVRAGLLPKLRKGALVNSEHWDITIIDPEDEPLRDIFRDVLSWTKQHSDANDRLVVFIDQFESLLVSAADATAMSKRHEAAQTFLKALPQILSNYSKVTLIIVMRDEFMARFKKEIEGISDWLNRGQYNIGQTLREDELREIIQQPAESQYLELEAGLVDLIIQNMPQVQDSSSSGNLQGFDIMLLPLLQDMLERLWQRRDQDGVMRRVEYMNLGGVTTNLEKRADDTFEKFTKGDTDLTNLTKRVFTDLVHSGKENEYPPTRRKRVRSELIRRDQERKDIDNLLDQFTDARLLVGAGENVSIIHDVLLREWRRLNNWLEELRRVLLWQENNDERVKQWTEKPVVWGKNSRLLSGADLVTSTEILRDFEWYLTPKQTDLIRASQKHAKLLGRLRGILIAILVLLLVMASTAAIIAHDQRNHARTNLALAEEREQTVLAQESLAVAESILQPICADEGVVPLLLCNEYVDPIQNIEQGTATLQQPAGRPYRPEDELALALETNISLVRFVFPVTEPLAVAINQSRILVGSKDGLELLEYQRTPIPIFGGEKWQLASESITLDDSSTGHAEVRVVQWLDDTRFFSWERNLAGGNDTLTVWQLSGKGAGLTYAVTQRKSFEDPINCAALQPDNTSWIAICDAQNLVLHSPDNAETDTLATFNGRVEKATWSPDGRWLAVVSPGIIEEDGSVDKSGVEVWDFHKGLSGQPVSFEGNYKGLQFLADDKLIAWTTSTVQWFELGTEDEHNPTELYSSAEMISGIAFPDADPRTHMLVYGYNGLAAIISAEPNKVEVELKGHEGNITAAAWHDKYLAVGIDDRTIHIWDTEKREQVLVLHGHRGQISGMTWSPDGYLYTYGLDNTLRVWHIFDQNDILQHQGVLYQCGPGTPNECPGMDEARWNQAGDQILVHINNTAWQIWRADETGVLTPTDRNFSLENAFWFDQETIIGYSEGALQWMDSGGTLKVPPIALSSRPQASAICGDMVFILQGDGTILQWTPKNPQPQIFYQIQPPKQFLDTSMNCTSGSERLLLAYIGIEQQITDRIIVWDIKSKQVAVEPFDPPGTLKHAAISPDGSLIAAWMESVPIGDGLGIAVLVWHTENTNETPLYILPQAASEYFQGFDWMFNSTRLLTYGGEFIRVWDINSLMAEPTGDNLPEPFPLLLTLKNSTPVEFAAFNAAGSRIISVDNDTKVIKIWRCWPTWEALANFAKNNRLILEEKSQ